MKTGITRYLCAAAELDRNFRQKVLEQIVYNRYCFVAPSYGADIATVAVQCIQAKKRDFFMDCALLFLLGWFVTAIFTDLLISWPLFLSFLVNIGFRIYPYWYVTNKLSSENISSDKAPALKEIGNDFSKKMEEMNREGNVIYFGGDSPFVGAGNRLSGWSFLAETKIKNSDEYIKLNNADLYTYIDSKMKELSISHMTTANALYVDGSKIRNDSRFLEKEMSSPKRMIDAKFLQEYTELEEEHVRFYKSIQITAWDGDFVFSTFFRVHFTPQNLFVEMQNYLLPPLKKEFYAIDKHGSDIPVPFIIKSILSSIIPTFTGLFKSIGGVLRGFNEFVAQSYKKEMTRTEIKHNLIFNYGARKSIRELAADHKLHNFFQESDVDMYRKRIEKRLLQSILEYLEEVNVDTREFKARENVIVNNGVMVTGGEINNSQITGKGNFKNKLAKVAEQITN
ncbi:hypothetical protein [Paenibacillus maysiensis]|uniref:hypothetical protein n=1 Tax=Paenibacillus maysiensis TaxID=1155954 RepID=UPI00046FE0B1|nr:hypothetical protein [Paenibacillus maysiensis]